MKLVTVVGARPQFIKAAVVSAALEHVGCAEVVVHTGQHYDDELSGVFFRELGLSKPAINLNVGSGSHGVQTSRILEGVEKVLLDERPDWALVYGDTNSTLAAVIAASKLGIPIAHVEAGPRAYIRHMPEEINRLVADQLADLLFAPTTQAVQNLRHEGIGENRIELVGDVMYDAALRFGQQANRESSFLTTYSLSPASYILCTIHRAENTDNLAALHAIACALKEVAHQTRVVMPLHPRTRRALQHSRLFDGLAEHVTVIPPLGYLDMLMAERHARLIVTDSGGVQKEAFFYRVPCVTLMERTAWPESVELGWNTAVLPDEAAKIVEAIHRQARVTGLPGEPYGDGTASTKIARRLMARLDESPDNSGGQYNSKLSANHRVKERSQDKSIQGRMDEFAR
jgi:UDP-GlcNAc3NAcA epimerase